MKRLFLLTMVVLLIANLCTATEKLKMSDEDLIEGYKVCIEKTGEKSDISQFMIQELLKRYEKDKIDKGICLGMIQKFYAENKYDNCLMFANGIVELYPKDIDGYFWRGYVYEVQRRYNEALMEYHTALLIKPTDWGTNVHLGDVYIKLAKNEKSDGKIECYKKGLSHYEMAKNTFEKEKKDLIVMDSEIKKVLRKLAVLYVGNMEYEKSLETYDLILKNLVLKDAEKCDLYFYKAMTYVGMNDKVNAKRVLAEIKKINSKSPAALVLEEKLKNEK